MSEVLFFFYFLNKDDAEKFSKFQLAQGFVSKTLDVLDVKDVEYKWSLKMTKNIDSDELMRLDPILTEVTKKFKGDYDGYER